MRKRKDLSGHGPIVALTSFLWLCYTLPLSVGQKSEISGIGKNRCRLPGRRAVGKVSGREGRRSRTAIIAENRIN